MQTGEQTDDHGRVGGNQSRSALYTTVVVVQGLACLTAKGLNLNGSPRTDLNG